MCIKRLNIRPAASYLRTIKFTGNICYFTKEIKNKQKTLQKQFVDLIFVVIFLNDYEYGETRRGRPR